MSFIYALAGLLHMARYAKNLRIQALAALAVLFLGLYLGLSGVEWAILAIVIALNILAEFMNAAIEAAVNLASPDYHPMAQVAKDVAAGGVLVSSLLALLIAGLILWPPLRQQLLGA
jgi:diacylglycerol kinase